MGFGANPVTIGRASTADLRLFSATVSRVHATVHSCDGAIMVEDHDSTYGTFVNGTRIRTAALSVGDRLQFGVSVAYRVEQSGLCLDRTPHGINLTIEQLGICRSKDLIVADVTLQVDVDRFIAILGPSGCGKSTLLGCLASFLSPATGRILVDGQFDAFEQLESYRSMLAYVPQDDLVYSRLTVRENLMFAARLKFGTEKPRRQLMLEIERVIDQVGLRGQVRQLAGTLSGGQRKRLSIAIELLKRPRLLLLDEPGSGLDPGTESKLMEQLRKIARRGTTVVCTTHLMQNLGLFDAVVTLGRQAQTGCLAYVGAGENLLDHFDCRSFADLYERLEDGRFECVTGRRQDRDTLSNSPSKIEQPSALAPTQHFGPTIRGYAQHQASLFGQVVSQFILLVGRTGLQLRRDPTLIALLLFQPLFLCGLIWLSQYESVRGAALRTLVAIVAIWMGLNNSVRELVRERKLCARDRLAGLRSGPYLASKFAIYGAIGAIQILVLILAYALPLDWRAEDALRDELRRQSLLWFAAVLWMVYLGGLGMGLLISTIAPTEEAAIAWLPLIIIPQLILSVVGSGRVEGVFYTSREGLPFRPLVAKWHSPEWLPLSDQLLDGLSFLCLSRPAAVLLTEPSISAEFGTYVWLGDLCHLLILLAAICAVTAIVFQRSQQNWPRLIGAA